MAQLNMKAVKAAYRDKHDRVVGYKATQVKRQGEVKERRDRKDWLGKLAGFFGIKLTVEVKALKQWMETITREKRQRGGSKLGLKLYKNQVRAIARVQRKQKQGLRISLTDIMRTGMPVRLRDLRGAV